MYILFVPPFLNISLIFLCGTVGSSLLCYGVREWRRSYVSYSTSGQIQGTPGSVRYTSSIQVVSASECFHKFFVYIEVSILFSQVLCSRDCCWPLLSTQKRNHLQVSTWYFTQSALEVEKWANPKML